MQSLKQKAKKWAHTGVKLLEQGFSFGCRPIYGGIGSIICFHSVLRRQELSPVYSYRAMCNSLEFVEALIARLQVRGVEMVSMDEVHERLQRGIRRRFVAFTFDDGYKDNLRNIFPLFSGKKIPLCIYVVPGLLDGEITLWWHRLADLVAGTQALDVRLGGRQFKYPCKTLLEKSRAFDAIAGFIRFGDQSRMPEIVRDFFSGHGTRQEDILMNWQEIETLSREPGVTIGAHTLTHRTLNLLPPEEIRREICGAREKIQARIQKPVEHFSYPFGGRNAVDAQVLNIARDCGYKTMVTTRNANIFPQHKNWMHALPRIQISGNHESLAAADVRLNGLTAARLYFGRRVVVD